MSHAVIIVPINDSSIFELVHRCQHYRFRAKTHAFLAPSRHRLIQGPVLWTGKMHCWTGLPVQLCILDWYTPSKVDGALNTIAHTSINSYNEATYQLVKSKHAISCIHLVLGR